MFTQSRHRWLGGLALLGILCVGVPGFAGAADRYKTQLEALRGELVTQSEQDAAGLAQSDIEQITTWLEQADAHLKAGDTDDAGYKLKRAEYGIDLVRALTVASQIEAKAVEQETAFGQSDDQVAALKAEVEALQAKKAELTQQLNQLR